jgi:outer membrane biosynthesis protein TonB
MAKTTGSLLLRIIVITVIAGAIFLALDHFLLPKGSDGAKLTREQAEQIGREVGTQIGREIGEQVGREIAAEMLAQRGTLTPAPTAVAEAPSTEEPSTEMVGEAVETSPPPAPVAPPPPEPEPASPAPAPAPEPAPEAAVPEPPPAPAPEPTPAPTPAEAVPEPAPKPAPPAAPTAAPAKEPTKFPRNASVKTEPAPSAWWEGSRSAKQDALVLRYAGQLSTSDKASTGIALLFAGRFDKTVNFSSISVSGPAGPVPGEWQLGANPGVIYLPAVPDGTYTVTVPAGFKDADGHSMQQNVSGPVTVKRN